MSEGMLIFLLSNLVTVFVGTVVLVWRFAETKNTILYKIDSELDLIRSDQQKLQSELVILTKYVESRLFTLTDHQASLKGDLKERISHLALSYQELVNHVNSNLPNSSHKFIVRRVHFNSPSDDVDSQLEFD